MSQWINKGAQEADSNAHHPQHGVRITEIMQRLADSRCSSGEVALDQALKDKENNDLRGPTAALEGPWCPLEPRLAIAIINLFGNQVTFS